MDPQTADFYTTRSREWAAALPVPWSEDLDVFLDTLPPGARILELGCGDGRDAARMAERGFDIEPTDGVPEMARLAGERLGRPVAVMPFDALAADGEYDAVWAHASLLHVPLAELPGIIARIHRALRPGGRHYASFKGGGGDSGAGGRDEHGRFYSYLSAGQIEAAYREAADWSALTCSSMEGSSFGGARTPWHSVSAVR